jgi:predicted NBD/HSP70 family sugar kinase
MLDKRALAVGCDIGGTNCKIGLIDSSGAVLESLSFPIDHNAGVDFFLHKLSKTIGRLIKNRPVHGIGVLVPGYLKDDRRVPYIMVNIPMLEDAPLHDTLEKRFGLAVALDIDRNGPCLAEYLFHYKDKVSRLMFVTIGTGVGVGLVVNGEISRFCNDSIGELGHVTLEAGGYRCVCGNLGCVETIVPTRWELPIVSILFILRGCIKWRQQETVFPQGSFVSSENISGLLLLPLQTLSHPTSLLLEGGSSELLISISV